MVRCINSPSTDIYFNLAAEEYLMKHSTEDVFMLWQDTPSVVVGKHQRIQAEVNMDMAKEKKIHIARRFSGGGAVYHDLGNVNLTFIETQHLPDFRMYLQRTLNFLDSIGLCPEGDERMGIYLNGLKISGSAQCVHRDRVLYHCTLLYDTNLPVLDTVLEAKENPAEKPVTYSVPSIRSEVTNIRAHLSPLYFPSLSPEKFRELIFQFFSKGPPIHSFTEKESEEIYQLRNEKYIKKDWIFR